MAEIPSEVEGAGRENMKDRTDLYEITLILTEGEKVSDIEKIIKEFGEIKKSTDLQVKQFAYPIGKLTSGHYYATEFVADGANISKIAQELKAEKSIIRYLITKALRKGPEPIRTGEWAKKPETEIKNVNIKNQNDSSKLKIEDKQTEKQKDRADLKPRPVAIEEPIVEEPVKEPKVETKPEVAEKVEIAEPKVEAKPEAPKNEAVFGDQKPIPQEQDKLVIKKPRTTIKRPKADKVSADELDKKLEELVKE